MVYLILQKYKFKSNSQQKMKIVVERGGVFDITKVQI